MNLSHDTITVMPLVKDCVEKAALLEKMALGAEAWSAEAIAETVERNGFYYMATNGQFLGHGGFTYAADEGYITNIAVDSSARRKGVATRLVDAMVRKAGELGLAFLSLEVRSSNQAAIALYERCGFTVRGVRPKFYRDPLEDAVIMTKDIGR